MNFPKVDLSKYSKDDLEWMRHAFIHARDVLLRKEQSMICLALETYQLKRTPAEVRKMGEMERYGYRNGRRAVLLCKLVVRDAIGPNLSFSFWYRQNNDNAPSLTVDSLGLTREMYERCLTEKLEAYRDLRVEWVSQILSIINIKL